MVNFTKNKRILCSIIAISTILVGCSDPVNRKIEYDKQSYNNMVALLHDQIRKLAHNIDNVHSMSDVTVRDDAYLSSIESIKNVSRLRQIAQREHDEYQEKIEKLQKRNGNIREYRKEFILAPSLSMQILFKMYISLTWKKEFLTLK
ncbi:hypothetical protein KP07_01020 [Candidatus Liberibacter solanacearum]|nr:hypothetical protein [Candidatus Liberibacter solanacearum]KJZ81484.1 hypothetical protein KP07_01020 [Candidatus Liberibacter solanacearum]